MINIKMYKSKWRVQIVNEEWEFDTMDEVKEILSDLMKMKDIYGRLSKYG